MIYGIGGSDWSRILWSIKNNFLMKVYQQDSSKKDQYFCNYIFRWYFYLYWKPNTRSYKNSLINTISIVKIFLVY